MEILGLVGIVLGLLLFLVLVYKGNSPFWCAALSAAVIAVFNLMAPADAIGAFTSGAAGLVATMLPICLGGAILGRLFSAVGATTAMAQFLTKKLVIKRAGDAQVRMAVLVCLIIAGLCTMGGIDAYILTFTLLPMIAVIAELVDIPRRFVPALVCLTSFFMAAPGAPQIDNIMARAGIMSFVYGDGAQALAPVAGEHFYVSAWAAPIPGLIAVIVMVVGGYFTLTHMILKAKRNGEHFEYGAMERLIADADRPLPPFGVAILPLVTVFFLYTVLPNVSPIQETPILIALAGGIAVTLITMGKYLPSKDKNGVAISKGKSAIKAINIGSDSSPYAFLQLVTPAAIAGVVTATAAFGLVIGALAGLNISYIVLTVIAVAIIVAITSSPPAALMVAMPVVLGIMLGHGIAPDAIIDAIPGIARVGALTATTLETLPFNGFILLTLSLAKTTHKESYPSLCVLSVIWTLIGTIVAAVLIFTFPGLS